jgi:hypothetical protein
MPHHLYTIGYTGWTTEDLRAEVLALGATLVDIRASPTSRTPHWRQDALRDLVGPRNYRHMPELGNRHDGNGGSVELIAPEEALGPVASLLRRGPVMLLCGCANLGGCHRLQAAHFLAERIPGLEVEHLQPPPLPAPPALRHALYALTLLQPHASCVAAAAIDRAVGKWVETRAANFPASYRGPLAIHAAARSSHGRNKIRPADLARLVAASPFAEALGLLGIREVDDLPFGQVIAVAEVVDVQPTDRLLGGLVPVGSTQYQLGDFGPGRLGIILVRIQRVDPPVPAVGAQGLWPWYDAPPELVAGLRAS